MCKFMLNLIIQHSPVTSELVGSVFISGSFWVQVWTVELMKTSTRNYSPLVSAGLSPPSGLAYHFCWVFVSCGWWYFNQTPLCRQDKMQKMHKMLWTHLVFCENSGLNSLSQKRYLHRSIYVLLSNQIEYFFSLCGGETVHSCCEREVVELFFLFLDTWGYVIFTQYKQ